jgi:hypothetical protein
MKVYENIAKHYLAHDNTCLKIVLLTAGRIAVKENSTKKYLVLLDCGGCYWHHRHHSG